MEQEEYTKEEIDWSYIEFVDNQDVLDLIEKVCYSPFNPLCHSRKALLTYHHSLGLNVFLSVFQRFPHWFRMILI